MKLLSVATSVLLAASINPTLGREIPNPARQANYDSGEMHMSIMGSKRNTFALQRGAGAYNSSQYSRVVTYSPCVDGIAAGEFRCKNVDLAYFASHAELGSRTGEGSSSWGWTSPEGREFIIIAQVLPTRILVLGYNADSSRPMALLSPRSCLMDRSTTLEDCRNKVHRKSGEVSLV